MSGRQPLDGLALLEHYAGLRDCARAARDGAEFEQRLGTPGFISDTTKRYCGEMQKIVGVLGQRPVTAADIWPFSVSCTC